jgi:hypothetical protein
MKQQVLIYADSREGSAVVVEVSGAEVESICEDFGPTIWAPTTRAMDCTFGRVKLGGLMTIRRCPVRSGNSNRKSGIVFVKTSGCWSNHG